MKKLIESARVLPLAFAQVREDSLLDYEVVKRLGDNLSILMIASGGCTASLLATLPNIKKMHIVDINNSQIALCKLKLKMLEECSTQERLEIMGHAYIKPSVRMRLIKAHLEEMGYPENIFGPIEIVSKIGPDNMGRYEYLFVELRNFLGENLGPILSVIESDSPLNIELKTILNNAFEDVMALPNLIALFGEEATQNFRKPFSKHFFDQTLMCIESSRISHGNPYLYQMLSGQFHGEVYYPWLNQGKCAIDKDKIKYSRGNMLEVLQSSQDEEYHFIHLSNITDWLSENEAALLLDCASKKLKKDGLIFIRQLNSNLDIPQLSKSIFWDREYANQLLSQDRSFFYPKLYLGVKV